MMACPISYGAYDQIPCDALGFYHHPGGVPGFDHRPGGVRDFDHHPGGCGDDHAQISC